MFDMYGSLVPEWRVMCVAVWCVVLGFVVCCSVMCVKWCGI